MSAVSSLLDQWTASLVEVLHSMADQKPDASWQMGRAPELEPEQIWWEQPFQIAPDALVWVAAPRGTWEHLGTITLKAAGLDTVELAEARNTYIEILGQSLSALARAIGGTIGREVSCAAGTERMPTALPDTGAAVALSFGEAGIRSVWIGFSPKLSAMVSADPEALKDEEHGTASAARTDEISSGHRRDPPTMELLLDVELPVSISFGKTALPMKDVLKLTTGSIVELNRGVNEPVEVLVNRCLVARGEVVVVEGNYGVRIQQIVSRQDRLRSLR
jgi:flagellar motor switch protein FliN/FliY